MILRRSDLLKRVADTTAVASWRVIRQTGISQVAAAQQVTLKPGDVVVAPPPPTASKTPTLDSSPGDAPGGAPEKHVDLPNRYITPDQTGTALLTLTIRVAAEGGGLAFDARDRSFSGVVLIGLEDSLRRTERIPLGGRIELQLTSDVARVDPPTIQIDHTNIPWKRVQVFARSPRDTVHLRIQAVFDPEGYAAKFARRP